MSFESDIEKFIHPINTAVAKAVADVKTAADKDKAVIGLDVRTAVANGEAAIKEATPELEAVAKAAAASVKALVEAALAAHGL